MSEKIFEQVKGRQQMIPVAQIRDARVALRKKVDKESIKYMELVDSIKKNGVLNAPSFTEEIDPADETKMLYHLVDGLHRSSAARDAGLTEIPGLIISGVDAIRILQLQIQGNTQSIPTRPIDLQKALLLILASDPTMTKLQIAVMLSKSEQYVSDILKLENLSEGLQTLTNEGTIKLLNAQLLSGLPVEHQEEYRDRAIAMAPVEFADLIRAAKAEINKARAAGRATGDPVFEPHPRLRTLTEVNAQVESMAEIKAILVAESISDSTAAARAALKWAMNMDAPTLALKKKAFDDGLAQKKIEAQNRKAEADKKKAEAADKEKTEEVNNFGPVTTPVVAA